MNCGLSNLETLKQYLLAGTLAGDRKFDFALQAVGLAAAGLCETFTNRKLGYLAGDASVFGGGRRIFHLQRYPISEVTSIKTRAVETDAWVEETGVVGLVNYESGKVDLGVEIADDSVQIQVIWSGGYFFETREPEEEGYPTAKPEITSQVAVAAGAVVATLPETLRAAYLLQCESIWATRDNLGVGLVSREEAKAKIGELKLSPLVEAMLKPFIRYALM